MIYSPELTVGYTPVRVPLHRVTTFPKTVDFIIRAFLPVMLQRPSGPFSLFLSLAELQIQWLRFTEFSRARIPG
jgi:hypothetical protein